MSANRGTPDASKSPNDSPEYGKRSRPSSATKILPPKESDLDDFHCPICFDVMEEAHSTKCGHTYCFDCITRSLKTCNYCPKCNSPLTGADQIFPNFLVNQLISKLKTKNKIASKLGLSHDSGNKDTGDSIKGFLAVESQNLSLPDVNIMLEMLHQQKVKLEAESAATKNKLLLEFLKSLLVVKEQQLSDINKELHVVKKDIEQVESLLSAAEEDKTGGRYSFEGGIELGGVLMMDTTSRKEAVVPEGMGIGKEEAKSNLQKNGDMFSSFSLRNRIVQTHFDDFAKCYFSTRVKEVTFGENENATGAATTFDPRLDRFRENMVKFSRYSKLRPLATLNYSNDLFNNSTIVSSIEFDKDNEFFAIAGVTKRIKVFDYNTVVKDVVDIHYPSVEMVSASKISCTSWNPYRKNILASSDYEGTVSIWDTSVGTKTMAFTEHEKRCWSVDFNEVDTRLLASGSDDSRVKLWSINMEHSVATLEAKANVCCVKFNPKSSCHIAFGSADHCIHYYDLRNMKVPLAVFKGHRKAVSYVKFLNNDEIISASTDGYLKLWNADNSQCIRSFSGHENAKNFVGLATDGDYIACGSENNALFIYYKGLGKQVTWYKFDTVRSVLDKEAQDEDQNQFVSAVCWRKVSNIVVAANSQGVIKILQLV